MRNRKASLSFQLILTMLLLVAGTVLLCWFFNGTFLEKYYVYNKQQEMKNSFHILDKAVINGELKKSSFDVRFENMCANANINMIILDREYVVVRSYSTNEQLFQMQLNDILFGNNREIGEVIAITEDYVLEKQTDDRLQAEYLVLWGTLDDGSSVYMRTALESIRESAQITNRFFVMVGSCALAISILIIILMSQSISRPIKELSGISKRMARLEFDAKYSQNGHGSREIEELGQSMNELSGTLERTISELKAANNELMQDIEKKERIDDMRKEFLSNVSHELKTPLALIQGYAEGLKECIHEDAESREFYCDVIMDEADKMNQMVKRLLTLNQLEFGNEIVEMSRFDMTELIQGVIQSQSLIAAQNGVSIRFEETEPTYVWGEEFRIEEVITNYLTNAFHHVEGEKRIEIRYTHRENLLRVSVFNTGKNIPEEDLDKVWIKFYKVDKARTREYGGNGIGLSIVKAIMDSHHRECGVKNHQNGVEFWIELETNS